MFQTIRPHSVLERTGFSAFRRLSAHACQRSAARLALAIVLAVSSAPDVRAADTPDDEPDPFAGNYTLGNSSEIALVWAGFSPDRDVRQRLYDVIGFNNPAIDDEILPQPEQVESGDFAITDGFGAARPDVATGDLDGDTFDDLISAWETPQGSVALVVPRVRAGTLDWTQAFRTQTGAVSPTCAEVGRVRLAIGNFDNDPEDEILLAYLADTEQVRLTIWDGAGTLTPVQVTSLDGEIIDTGLRCDSRVFDVDAGDLDGDGIDDILVAGAAPFSGNGISAKVFVRAYRVVPGSSGAPPTIVAKGQAETVYSRSGLDFLMRLAVVAGDFDDDTVDEGAIGFQAAQQNCCPTSVNLVQTFDLSEDLETVNLDAGEEFSGAAAGRVEQNSRNGGRGFSTQLVAFDVNRDGREELFAGSRGEIRVYAMDDSLEPRSVGVASVAEQSGAHRFFDVADTNSEQQVLDNGGVWRPELVAIEQFEVDPGIDPDSELNVSVQEVAFIEDPTTGAVTDVDFNTLADLRQARLEPSGVRPVALALGDFDGDAVRLGPPEFSRRTEIVQPLVVLNAPPTHFDLLPDPDCPGGVCDVNECFNLVGQESCDFVATHLREVARSIEVSTEVTADWAVSSEVSGGGSFLGVEVSASLRGSYGERFSKSSRRSRTITIEDQQSAVIDDFIYATVADYDVWEYPIFANSVQQGFVVAVVPRLTQRRWFDSKSYSANTYVPNHEVGNILSYKEVTQPDENDLFAEIVRFQTGDGRTLGPTGSGSWSLTEEGQIDTTTEFQVDWSVGASVGFEAFGFGATTDGDYSETSISTHSSSVRDQRGLTVELGSLDGSLGNVRYTVTPYVYWAQNGALVLDYAVQPDLAGTGDVSTFWDQHYGTEVGDPGAPDPAFILPWRYDPEKGLALDEAAQRERTREILFDPPEPERGEVVTITARVHNWSLLPTVGPVEVRFYDGDPDAGGTAIVGTGGETEVLTVDGQGFPMAIPARGDAFARMEWRVPDELNVPFRRIYARIDPDGEVSEIHESNNTGWSVLVPVPEPGVLAQGATIALLLALSAKARRRAPGGRTSRGRSGDA